MASLWSVTGDEVHVGYKNIRIAKFEAEKEMKAQLEAMWSKFEPYADQTFIKQFSQDPDAHFWEMYLGGVLLDAGKTLLTATDRKTNDCLPDLCVVEGGRRFWIEAIAPDKGQEGPNQVKGPKPMNEGGGWELAPTRQAHLRMTSALVDKSQVIENYMAKGAMKDDDVRLIAIGVGRFGQYVSENPPSILSALFPIGDEYVTVNKATGEIVELGYHHSPTIEKQGDKKSVQIPRTAFLEDTFKHVSGIVWSRVSIGNFDRKDRPLTLVHNPKASKKMDTGWAVWDGEWIAEKKDDGWQASNLKAVKKSEAALE